MVQKRPSLTLLLWQRLECYPSWTWLQFARTVLAVGSLITVILNTPRQLLFNQVPGSADGPNCEGVKAIGAFCVLRGHNGLAQIICAAGLVLVISGFGPMVTGIVHWWVAFSLYNTASTGDGGDQVANVICLLLIPICLACPRFCMWTPRLRSVTRISDPVSRAISSAFLTIVALQVSVIYFQSSVSKFGTVDWPQGTAMWYWIQDPIFGLGGTAYASFGRGIFGNTAISVLATWGTLVVEFILAMLTLARSRWLRIVTCFIAVTLHGSILVVLGLGSFGLQMIGVGLLIFAINGAYEPTLEVAALANRQEAATAFSSQLNRQTSAKVH